jgi:hypothetical protein
MMIEAALSETSVRFTHTHKVSHLRRPTYSFVTFNLIKTRSSKHPGEIAFNIKGMNLFTPTSYMFRFCRKAIIRTKNLLLLFCLSIFNCNWVDARWQQYSTHLHTNSTQNTENETHINIKKIGKCGLRPLFASYALAFALQLRKKHGKTSVRVFQKFPTIPVAAVQYTFTHKQYTDQHNETEHTERNIHNNKNTYVS